MLQPTLEDARERERDQVELRTTTPTHATRSLSLSATLHGSLSVLISVLSCSRPTSVRSYRGADVVCLDGRAERTDNTQHYYYEAAATTTMFRFT